MFLLLFLDIFGCQTTSDTDDEWILTNIKNNPIAVQEHFSQMTDPMARTVAIMDLVERYPNRTKPLCTVLPSKISLERCLRLTERPHLWKKQRNHFDTKTTSTPRSDRSCNLSPHPNTCWTAQALEDVSQDLDRALDACQQISESRWQAECYFSLAEYVGSELSQLGSALDICKYTQQFQKSCWMHVVVDQAQQSKAHLDSWEWYKNTAAQIQHSTAISSDFAADLTDHFWAQSVWRLWDLQLLSKLPEPPVELDSIVLDLQSIDMVRWCDMPIQNLDSWANILLSTNQSCPKLSKPRGLDLESDVWQDMFVPEGCEVRSFLGQSHRLSCPKDPILEAKLSLLEVSARIRPMPKTWLQESLQVGGVLERRAQMLISTDLTAPPDRR